MAMLADEALRLALAERGEAVVTIVPGDRSMEPILGGGDAVLAVPLEDPPVRGDLLVFRQNDYLVVHRYLGPASDQGGVACLRTRGDGVSALDPPVAAGAVRGKARAFRHEGAWFSLEGRAPRLFASGLACHGLAWSAAAHLARPWGLARPVAALDRLLLRLVAAVALPLAHRRIAAPRGAVPHVSV